VGADAEAARQVARQVFAQERAHLQAKGFVLRRKIESHLG
jgi:hypothetical protein